MIREETRKPAFKIGTYLKYGFVIMEEEICLCPRCSSRLNAGPDYQPKYCGQCGQSLDFLEVVWKDEKRLGFLEREV